jgi:hypothetical protein
MEIGRLDIAMHQAGGMGFGQRMAGLPEEMDDPPGRLGTEPPDEGFEVDAVQQLHDEIELAVGRDPEVVELYGMRRAEAGGGLRFAAEALQRQLGELAPPSNSDSALMSLIAAGRASRRWWACHTSPIPPSPIKSPS